jgi:hypothetical protein
MRTLHLLPTTLLATAALAPAALAASGDIHLKSGPTMTRVDAKTVQVSFKTDRELPRRADGKVLGSVEVHGGESSIGSAGKSKTSYTSYAKLGKAKRGAKFTVTIHVKGQPDIARNVTLR